MALKRRRLLWVLISPILALLLLELVLQAGALAVSSSSSDVAVGRAESGEAGHRLIAEVLEPLLP